MNRRWQPYPSYNDSGVKWLGEIPAHWEAKKIKWLSKVRRGASPRPIDDPIYFDDAGEYAWVRISDVTASAKYLIRTEQNLSELGKSKSVPLEPGEIFLSIAATVGKSIITKIKCCIHDGFVYFVGLEQNREYLFYVLSGDELYQGLGKQGTQLNLNTETVGDIQIPVPPPEEQRAIAAFLDTQTAKIDATIAEQRRLIDLLHERRAALISRAVTRGLDPDVPCKDSGIEWLGEIPVHWPIKPLWAIAYLQRGHDLTRQDRIEGDIPVVSSSGVFFYHNEAKAKGPGVVTGRYGTVGEIIYVEQDYWPMNTTLYVREFYGNHPRYIYHLLSILPFDAYSGKSAVPGIDRNDLHPLSMVCPPVEEQRAIAVHLDRETAKIDAVIAEVETAIVHLEEYRTALIAAAVTGKIDVRGPGHCQPSKVIPKSELEMASPGT